MLWSSPTYLQNAYQYHIDRNVPDEIENLFDAYFVTTHVVRLKLFRLKAEGVQKVRLTHFGGERADFRTKQGFKMSRISVFPNSLQPSVYPPE
jgi:hypothetical protein